MNKFNLSLDDYSPHKATRDLTWANKLIEQYPNIKIDLFIPAAFCRLQEGRLIDYGPNYLSKNLDWVEEVKQLKPNYNICLHGFYHRRSKKDYAWNKSYEESNNDEFRYLVYRQAEVLLNRIEEEFDKVGLKYKKVFRPPAWKISSEAVKLLKDRGYMIAGSKEWEKSNSEAKVKWISYNWDLLTKPPEGDVVAYGHTSNWTTNYMNEERYNTIMNFLKDKQFDFRFIEEM